jgi:hypothetical protein
MERIGGGEHGFVAGRGKGDRREEIHRRRRTGGGVACRDGTRLPSSNEWLSDLTNFKVLQGSKGVACMVGNLKGKWCNSCGKYH